jgi:hypothetical protein
MLTLMDARRVDPEEWVKEKMAFGKSGIAEVDVDDEEGNEREYDIAAQSAKASVGV